MCQDFSTFKHCRFMSIYNDDDFYNYYLRLRHTLAKIDISVFLYDWDAIYTQTVLSFNGDGDINSFARLTMHSGCVESDTSAQAHFTSSRQTGHVLFD